MRLHGLLFLLPVTSTQDSTPRDWSETSNPRREGHQGSGDSEAQHPCGSWDGGNEEASDLWVLHSTPATFGGRESSSHFFFPYNGKPPY